MTTWRARASAHLETWRPYTSCYVGVVGLAGAGLAAGYPGSGRLLAAWAIPTIGWVAGLYGGDYFDRKLDALSKPQRPIPSGRLQAGTALGCMIVLIAAGAALTTVLNWRALMLVVAATVIGLSYNAYFKAKGLAGNLVRGSLTGFALLFGDLVAGGGIAVLPVALAVVFAIHDSGSNLVGTLRDIDGDRDGGYATYPVRHGVPTTVRMVSVLLASWMGLAIVVLSSSGRGWDAPTAVALAVALLMSWSVAIRLYWARDAMTRRFALRMHQVLCLERIVLAAAVAAWGAGLFPAITAGVPALAVTWVSQVRLRSRHEFPVTPVPPGTWPVQPAIAPQETG